MNTQNSNLETGLQLGQLSDWNDFQDETIQFDTWNLNFDDDEEEKHRTDRTDDTDRDDNDPNRYLG